MGTDMRGNLTNHDHDAVPTTTGAAEVAEGTHHTPHPATTAADAALWLIDAPIATHAMTHLTGIVAPNPTLTTSVNDITHTTMPQTAASLTLAPLTTLLMENSQ